MAVTIKSWRSSISDLNSSIHWGVLKKKIWELIFNKGAKCFEVKNATNHELEAHGYGGGEEEDEEYDDSMCVWVEAMDEGEEGEDKSVVIFVRRSGGD